MGIEIERKFIVTHLPEDLESYPHRTIEQGYLNTKPVVRVRRDGDEFYMTYKGKGKMEREEYNLPLNEEAYYHLLEKSDGNVICKERYCIPYENSGKSYTIELDIFNKQLEPLVMAEVEFDSVEEANAFVWPSWFKKEVTEDKRFHNSNMIDASYVVPEY